MSRRVGLVLAAACVVGSTLEAQSLQSRVNGVRDGVARFSYAVRPDACGDGKDVITLGRTLIVYPSVEGHGTTNSPCVLGPVRAAITLEDGSVSGVRVYVGGRWSASASGRDLGTVRASDAAAYMLALAERLSGKAAKAAVAGAALADSTDVWRDLLDLARSDDRPSDLRRNAMFWLGAVAPEEAVSPIAALARNTRERRDLREGALSVLAHIDNGAGVQPLMAMTERDDPDAPWLREKAVFWLGNAGDARGRTRVRQLAERDSVPERIREQAIFALGHLDGEGDNGPFLRSLYTRTSSERLKKKMIQSLGQLDDPESERFLLRMVQSQDEPMSTRKDALFWAGQNQHASTEDLVAVYGKLDDREIRQHYTFVLSQRRETAAVEKLIDIARNDADRGVRKQALFWLGQSDDPRAMRFLREVIEK